MSVHQSSSKSHLEWCNVVIVRSKYIKIISVQRSHVDSRLDDHHEMVTSWMHACSFVCYTRRVNEVTAVQLPSRWRRDQSSYGVGRHHGAHLTKEKISLGKKSEDVTQRNWGSGFNTWLKHCCSIFTRKERFC